MWSTFPVSQLLHIFFIIIWENNLVVSTEAGHAFPITQKFCFHVFTQQKCVCLPKDMYRNAHSTAVNNSPKLEIAQMLINNKTDK